VHEVRVGTLDYDAFIRAHQLHRVPDRYGSPARGGLLLSPVLLGGKYPFFIPILNSCSSSLLVSQSHVMLACCPVPCRKRSLDHLTPPTSSSPRMSSRLPAYHARMAAQAAPTAPGLWPLHRCVGRARYQQLPEGFSLLLA